MRSRKALLNTATGLLYELITVVCGLILPRLILGYFGSQYNGIVSSITQFISCVALMKAGIGGVSRAALYRALASGDDDRISAIVKATQKFMNRVSAFFIVFVVGFSVIYSLFFSDEFGFFFTLTLVIVISISSLGEYFLGFTYEVLISADQKQYVFSVIRMCTTILNTVIASILIISGCEIRIVKLASSLVFLLNPVVIRIYARKRYNIKDDVEVDKNMLSQRWDAVGHEVANFINTNTDIMVLTVLADMYEVSVYTVYNNVIFGVRKLINTFINGFGAAFGNMYAKGEYELMESNFKLYELIVFSLSSVVYSICSVMLVPYSVLYANVDIAEHVDYARPLFSLIIVLAGAFSCFRIPYQNVVTVAGHFKQTRNGAFLEAILNITISVACVVKFGLVGVAVGTLVANVFRTVQYVFYMSANVLKRSVLYFFKHLAVFAFVIIITNLIFIYGVSVRSETAFEWVLSALGVGITAVVLTFAFNAVFYMSDTKRLMKKVISMTGRGKKKA